MKVPPKSEKQLASKDLKERKKAVLPGKRKSGDRGLMRNTTVPGTTGRKTEKVLRNSLRACVKKPQTYRPGKTGSTKSWGITERTLIKQEEKATTDGRLRKYGSTGPTPHNPPTTLSGTEKGGGVD